AFLDVLRSQCLRFAAFSAAASHAPPRSFPTRRSSDLVASYTEQRMITCQRCGHTEKLEQRAANGSWSWEIVLVERVQKGRREIADRKSTRLNSSHVKTSYAVLCLKKKNIIF